MPSFTLLDLAKLNGDQQLVNLIEDTHDSAPEVRFFPVMQIKGTHYKPCIRTGLPTVGFRAANSGLAPSKSTFAQGLTELFILDSSIEVDAVVANGYVGGVEAFKQMESEGVMQAALIKLGTQIWYGLTADANGFIGIKALTPKTATAGTSNQVIDAGGTTASTASSCYAVRFGKRDVQLVFGNNQTIKQTKWWAQQKDLGNGIVMSALMSSLCSWVGLQFGNMRCIGRIFNLTEDSGKGLTDTLIAKLLEKFPRGSRPHALFASRRSVRQLQVSRTSINKADGDSAELATPGPDLAPWPTSALGIPLIDTDSILDTDAIE